MKYLTEQELKEAADELGLEFEEAKLMYERALNAGLLANKSLKGFNKLANTLKAKRQAVANDKGELGHTEPVKAKPEDDTPQEEIPDVVIRAARILDMPAQQLFDMMRTKAVGIQGGVPHGSQTRLRQRERMVTPLRDVVHGKLLAILKGNLPPHVIGEAFKAFSDDELKEAGNILRTMSVTEFFGINTQAYTFKETGVEWQDAVQAGAQQLKLKQDLQRQFGIHVIENYKALTNAVSATEQTIEAAKLERAFKPVDRFTSQKLNAGIHPAILAEMERKNLSPTVLTQHKSLVDGQHAAKADAHADMVYQMATSTAMNPELETTLKALAETLPPPDLYNQFTSRRLNGLPLQDVIKTERQVAANAYNRTQLAQMTRDEENLRHFHATGNSHPRYSKVHADHSPR